MPGLVSAGVHFTTVVILIVLMPLSGQHLGNVHFFTTQWCCMQWELQKPSLYM